MALSTRHEVRGLAAVVEGLPHKEPIVEAVLRSARGARKSKNAKGLKYHEMRAETSAEIGPPAFLRAREDAESSARHTEMGLDLCQLHCVCISAQCVSGSRDSPCPSLQRHHLNVVTSSALPYLSSC